MTEGDKLTTIVRKDLSDGYRVVQTAHAVANFAIEHTTQFKAWQLGSNYLCCLEASEFRIYRLIDKLEELKIKYTVFTEPDIGDEMTAICVEAVPQDLHKKLFKNLKLTS